MEIRGLGTLGTQWRPIRAYGTGKTALDEGLDVGAELMVER